MTLPHDLERGRGRSEVFDTFMVRYGQIPALLVGTGGHVDEPRYRYWWRRSASAAGGTKQGTTAATSARYGA
ncbi:MAG: hypothetical protein N2037_09865 [Acidimicrobiales bacterium]|nr:hypothetical protein [Acidimicrobiales bacterium]